MSLSPRCLNGLMKAATNLIRILSVSLLTGFTLSSESGQQRPFWSFFLSSREVASDVQPVHALLVAHDRERAGEQRKKIIQNHGARIVCRRLPQPLTARTFPHVNELPTRL